MGFYDIARMIAALAITLGLLMGFAYLARRYGWLNGNFTPQIKEKRIKIVEQTFLDARGSRLMIIDVDGEEQLLMIAPNGAKILKSLNPKLLNPKLSNQDKPVEEGQL